MPNIPLRKGEVRCKLSSPGCDMPNIPLRKGEVRCKLSSPGCDMPNIPLRKGEVRCKLAPVKATQADPEPEESSLFDIFSLSFLFGGRFSMIA